VENEEQLFLDFNINIENEEEEQENENRIIKIWRKYLIDPNNSKLKKFHLLCSLALFVDFFLTSFIVGNYKF